MGGLEIFLDGLTREEALALVRTVRSVAPESRPEAASTRTHPAASEAESGAERSMPIRDAPRSPAGTGSRGASPSGARPRAASAAAGSEGATSSLPVLPDDYDELRDMALACTRCGLSEGRTQVVFSDGPRDARLMVVGEAPGANEDETGLPFVGAAGKYLDLLLATVGLSREESVYIANVLKCRPPGNRNPTADEIEACSPFLRKQIDLVRPEALLAVGSFSAKLLTGRDGVSLGALRGEVHTYHGVPLVVTYHPAALLRNPRWTRLFWDDLQLLRDVMDGK
jgi:uracil-DNA glycosylase